jgi:PIN domain nuclease of toxin-antitoxin system
MIYLIDTQILIWYQLNSEKLNPEILVLLRDVGNTVYVSAISLFEIAIKQKIGKLPALDMTIASLSELIIQDGFTLLEIKTAHLAAYADIPLMLEHRDPFDRLLLATAFCEIIPIISADQNFAQYRKHPPKPTYQTQA